MDRRKLLKATAAVPLLGVPKTAPAALTEAPRRFSIAVLPDTQYLFDADAADPAPLRETFRYLVRERAAVFLTHLGDITEHGTDQEIALASATFRELDGKLPYSVLAGNHDVPSTTDDQRGETAYRRAFGPHRYAGSPTFAAASPDGYNSAHVVSGGGRQWLILALDWHLSDLGIAWAQSILDQHERLPAIVTTHDLAYPDYAGEAALSTNGRRLWDRLIRDNDQIFLTLNGHHWPPARTVLTNAAGHAVQVHIANYQDRYYGGAAMIRLYTFDLDRDVIDVETFAPWFLARDPATRNRLEAETAQLTGPDDRFSMAVDFDARFAGFDPSVRPAPRPATTVIDRTTAAYWRFDTPGQALTDGSTVRDQTNKGNDLTVRGTAGRIPLTLSADHHPDQPGPGSVRFDGGRNPDRGTMLQTGPNAPLNSAKFLDGYTIELFLKLPDPFVGDHSFMGIFSWEGRNGDAGKTSGWSPLEPPCSLNLSSERFLQYVLYPETTDANPTSWSHALPMGRWTHLAVVNDSRHTVIWVDGAPIVRNPRTPARGIATVGRPFVLGATSFDLKYGQSFYGWIGDVRISARALDPGEFLLPASDS